MRSGWPATSSCGWLLLLCCLALLSCQAGAVAVDFDMQEETVDLTWHLLGDEGVQKLVKKLPRSKCRHLILSKNEITHVGAGYLADLLESDFPLVTLDLNGNQIGPDGVRAIMRGIKDHVFIETLLFPFVTMGDAGAKALAKGLASHPTVKSLNVMYANIREMGAEFLGEMLETNTVLEVLQLDGNKLGDLGAESLAEGLKHNQKLQHLFVGNGNEVADYGAMKLAEALTGNKQLKTLSLQGNNIVYIGLEKLASMLPSTAIETLNLRENAFKSSGANKLFKALAAHPSNLQLLDVSANHIANDAANAIRDFLATNPPLLALDLTFNRLRPGGIVALLQGLASNTNLRRLDLSGNQIEPAGAVAVAAYLASRGGENPCGVTNLGLGMGYIGDEGATALANALAHDECLTILSLASYNEITDVGATAIAQMLETNTHLLALDIFENKIGEAGCDAIAAALRKNTKLQYLKVMGCSPEAERAIEQALERNKAAVQQEEATSSTATASTQTQASAQDEL